MGGVQPVHEVYQGRPDRSWRVCHGEDSDRYWYGRLDTLGLVVYADRAVE